MSDILYQHPNTRAKIPTIPRQTNNQMSPPHSRSHYLTAEMNREHPRVPCPSIMFIHPLKIEILPMYVSLSPS